ncbi:hypothetical protein HYH03_001513 [Edaphochlamys debaryana]|uniref:Protein kinase domain-containing protein n=1 Tax=Edaphochlamys debaryana TaxID=47281 RepID=A0A835YN45_9CHLO|nr:hypothetical protein HYH03_001513 [Edaphochlamys debaryana]|eukprot:KAG2500749.1 hypothetical protein HYH03_001513 [Edaphochlamys debaryana]
MEARQHNDLHQSTSAPVSLDNSSTTYDWTQQSPDALSVAATACAAAAAAFTQLSSLQQLHEELTQLAWLGSGSGGRVYSGLWRGSPVAVKIIVSSTPDEVRESMREAILGRVASHPHMVQAFAAFSGYVTDADVAPKQPSPEKTRRPSAHRRASLATQNRQCGGAAACGCQGAAFAAGGGGVAAREEAEEDGREARARAVTARDKAGSSGGGSGGDRGGGGGAQAGTPRLSPATPEAGTEPRGSSLEQAYLDPPADEATAAAVQSDQPGGAASPRTSSGGGGDRTPSALRPAGEGPGLSGVSDVGAGGRGGGAEEGTVGAQGPMGRGDEPQSLSPGAQAAHTSQLPSKPHSCRQLRAVASETASLASGGVYGSGGGGGGGLEQRGGGRGRTWRRPSDAVADGGADGLTSATLASAAAAALVASTASWHPGLSPPPLHISYSHSGLPGPGWSSGLMFTSGQPHPGRIGRALGPGPAVVRCPPTAHSGDSSTGGLPAALVTASSSGAGPGGDSGPGRGGGGGGGGADSGQGRGRRRRSAAPPGSSNSPTASGNGNGPSRRLAANPGSHKTLRSLARNSFALSMGAGADGGAGAVTGELPSPAGLGPTGVPASKKRLSAVGLGLALDSMGSAGGGPSTGQPCSAGGAALFDKRSLSLVNIGGAQLFSARSRTTLTLSDLMGSAAVLDERCGHTSELWEVLSAAGAVPGRYCTLVIMERCDQGTLQQLAQRLPFCPARSVENTAGLLTLLRTALEVAQGMCHLHALDIVHGDLKPSNVLLQSNAISVSGPKMRPWDHDTRGFTAKISDFGLAALQQTASLPSPAEPSPFSGASRETRWGALPYMAPEVPEHGPSKPTDVWSYGMLLYFMCAGKPPYHHVGNLHPAQLLMGIVDGSFGPEWPHDTYRLLRRLAEACCQRPPAARPPFARIVTALQRLIRHVAAHPEPSNRSSVDPSGSSLGLGGPGGPGAGGGRIERAQGHGQGHRQSGGTRRPRQHATSGGMAGGGVSLIKQGGGGAGGGVGSAPQPWQPVPEDALLPPSPLQLFAACLTVPSGPGGPAPPGSSGQAQAQAQARAQAVAGPHGDSPSGAAGAAAAAGGGGGGSVGADAGAGTGAVEGPHGRVARTVRSGGAASGGTGSEGARSGSPPRHRGTSARHQSSGLDGSSLCVLDYSSQNDGSSMCWTYCHTTDGTQQMGGRDNYRSVSNIDASNPAQSGAANAAAGAGSTGTPPAGRPIAPPSLAASWLQEGASGAVPVAQFGRQPKANAAAVTGPAGPATGPAGARPAGPTAPARGHA